MVLAMCVCVTYKHPYQEVYWPYTYKQRKCLQFIILKVIYHSLYSMINFVTNKYKLPQDGAQVFPYMGWLAIMWPTQTIIPIYGVIGYHVTLREGHMIANHPT